MLDGAYEWAFFGDGIAGCLGEAEAAYYSAVGIVAGECCYAGAGYGFGANFYSCVYLDCVAIVEEYSDHG
jgi:hypothetical protein